MKRIAIIVVILTGYSEAAELGKPRWEMALTNGYAIPVAATADTVGGSYALAGSASYFWKDWLRPGLEFGYSFNHSIKGTAVVPDMDADGIKETLNFTTTSKGKVFHATPFLKIGKVLNLPLPSENRLQWLPYLLIGCGYFHSAYNAGTSIATGATSRGFPVTNQRSNLAAASHDFFGINLGMGFDILVRDRLRLGPSVQYHHFFAVGPDRRYIYPALRLTYAL